MTASQTLIVHSHHPFFYIKKAGDGNRTHVSSLEGWCSTIELHPQVLSFKSGWQDSNLRPPGPKPGALAKLSHTPLFFFIHLCFVVRRKTYYMVTHPKCQHFFSIFFDFFWKSDFSRSKKFRKASKIKGFRGFNFFEKSWDFFIKNGFSEWFL